MPFEIINAHVAWQRSDGCWAYHVFYRLYGAPLAMTVPSAENLEDACSQASQQVRALAGL